MTRRRKSSRGWRRLAEIHADARARFRRKSRNGKDDGHAPDRAALAKNSRRSINELTAKSRIETLQDGTRLGE